jgi:hypothetical protein
MLFIMHFVKGDISHLFVFKVLLKILTKKDLMMMMYIRPCKQLNIHCIYIYIYIYIRKAILISYLYIACNSFLITEYCHFTKI